MNRTFVKSTLILSIATLLSKILGSIFRIPLQNIAGDEVLGIFSLVYPVYMVALTLSVAGIPIAISKLISEARAKDNEAEIGTIYKTASILALLFGLISFTMIYSFSDSIAYALGGESSQLALIIVAVTLLIAPYMAVYRGFFQGFEDMRPTAISQVLEQFIRVILILGVAYLLVRQQQSNEVVAGGVMIGSSIGALASLIYLRSLFVRSSLRPKKAKKYSFNEFKTMSATILKISLPVCVGAITMALLNFIDSVTVPAGLRALGHSSNEIHFLYGIYGRGLALVQIATVVSSSLVLPLIPYITGALAKNEHLKAKNAVDRAHGLAHFVSWPAAFGLTVLTLPINLALFTDLEGSTVLAIISFSSLFTSLTILGTGILQGMNRSMLAAWIIVIGVGLKWLLNVILVKKFGLIGAAFSTAIIYVILFVVNTFFIWKTIRFSILKRETFVFIASAFIMAGVIGGPLLYVSIESWSRVQALAYVGSALIVGVVIYGIFVIAFKGLDNETLQSIPFLNKITSKIDKNGRVRKIKMKKWLWIVLIAALVLTIPSIIDRSKAEWTNRIYETIIPYQDIRAVLSADKEIDRDQLFEQLKSAGLQSISLEPDTLGILEEKDKISIISDIEMRRTLLLSGTDEVTLPEEDGVFVYIKDQTVKQMIRSLFTNSEAFTILENQYEFIPLTQNLKLNRAEKERALKETPILYDRDVIQAIKEHGFYLVPRIPNRTIEEENQHLVDQLLAMKDEQTEKILFVGESVTGSPNRNQVLDWSRALHDVGYSVFSIEFSDQKDFTRVANVMDFDVIRLHSINLDQKTHQVNVDQVVRAVKERNIKAIFIRMPLNKTPDEVMEDTLAFLQDVQLQMPSFFTLGQSQVFTKVDPPLWQKAFGLLAGIAFAGLAAFAVTKNRKLTYIALAGMSVVALAHLATGMGLLLKAFALAVAVTGPVYAVVPKRTVQKTKDLFREYGFAAIISFIAIWIIVVLLNGTEFLVKVDAFRGVKLVYIIPIAFMVLYALFGSIKTLLKTSIRYWHLGVLFLIAAIVVYYIMRTGNAGTVSSIELTFRQLLEQVMYVRPRTKEFLIGFPFFVLALYIMRTNKVLGLILLVPSVIGFLSLVNTFTHLHIPLYVSMLRSVYSLVLGLVVGFIFIYLYRLAVKYYAIAKERWLT